MKESIFNFYKNVENFTRKHKPELLVGIGIAGLTIAGIGAVLVTPKAMKAVDEEIEKKNDDIWAEAIDEGVEKPEYIEKLKPVDVAKVTWKLYFPYVVTYGVSVACIVCSSRENMKRNAALAAAYTFSESALKEYKEKVVEKFGEKKEESVRDSISKDKIDNCPVQQTQVLVTGFGDTLCFEPVTSRYFTSSIEKINRAVNDLNKEMISDMYVSLNEFFNAIGVPNADAGDILGWHIDRGLIDLHFSSHLTQDDKPCIVLDYLNPPRYDFMKG